MIGVTIALTYIDAALGHLPRADPGTPLAREVAAIREHLLIAKARLITLERDNHAS